MNAVDTHRQTARRLWRAATGIVVVAAGAAAGLGLTPRSASAATMDPARGVSITAITVAADYSNSHAVYAIAQRPDCQTACAELLRSRDGGATWVNARARGWTAGGLASLPFRGGAMLVAESPGTIATSLDGGDSFTTYATDGSPGDAAANGGDVDVAVSNASGMAVVTLPRDTERPAPRAAGLDNAALSLTTAYPTPPAGVPAAIAIGIDHASGTARLEHCDATLSCTSPVPIASGGTIVSSPAFARDLTFFFLGASELQRSTDGGRTLTPITVMPPSPQTLATGVTGLVFTPEFDSTTHGGTVFAAVISASRATRGGRLSGGVFRSDDAGATWTRTGSTGDMVDGASALARAPDGRMFAGTYEFGNGKGGIYCSVGGSWSAECPAYRSTPSEGTGTTASSAGSAPATPPADAAPGGPVRAAATTPTPPADVRAARVALSSNDLGSWRRITVGLAVPLLLAATGGALIRRRRIRRVMPME